MHTVEFGCCTCVDVLALQAVLFVFCLFVFFLAQGIHAPGIIPCDIFVTVDSHSACMLFRAMLKDFRHEDAMHGIIVGGFIDILMESVALPRR